MTGERAILYEVRLVSDARIFVEVVDRSKFAREAQVSQNRSSAVDVGFASSEASEADGAKDLIASIPLAPGTGKGNCPAARGTVQ